MIKTWFVLLIAIVACTAYWWADPFIRFVGVFVSLLMGGLTLRAIKWYLEGYFLGGGYRASRR